MVACIGLLGALTLGVTLSSLAAYGHLTRAEAELRSGRSEFLVGEAGEAERRFDSAGAEFEEALRRVRDPWVRVFGWVPVIGRTPDAVEGIAEAGVRVAEAGATLADAVTGLPGGLDALAPSDGRFPLEQLEALAIPLAETRDETAAAIRALDSAPRTFLLGQVGAARAEAEDELRSLHEVLDSGARVLEGLPTFLGGDGPKRYFFGAQNPAELRGTGGVIGAYSILTIDDGRFRFSGFAPVQSLPAPHLEDLPPPSEDYAGGGFRGGGRFWLAINLSPDYPTTARALLDAYEQAAGERLDGVILADPFALEALLRVTGPAYVSGLGETVGADDVVAFTTNEAYSLFEDSATRKRVLGAVAEAAFGRFLAQGGTDVDDLRVLAEAAAEGHILAYSEDPTMQSGLEATGAGGALQADPGDLFAVVENSSGGNKVDYYQERDVRYEVDLWPDGAAEARAEVELTNRAPTTGQPAYVIGPAPGYSRVGESGQLVSVYCAAQCQLEGAKRDGREIAVWARSELGYPFFQDYFRTPSGETSRLELTWYVPDAWDGDGTGGTYHLTFLNQTTIRPTELTVEIRAPDGMGISDASPGMLVEGATAVWKGVPEHRLELEITFQPTLLMRLWRTILD